MTCSHGKCSPGTETRATSPLVLSPPTVGFLSAGQTCGQKTEVGSHKRAEAEVCRERKTLETSWFDFKMSLRWVPIGARITGASGRVLCAVLWALLEVPRDSCLLPPQKQCWRRPLGHQHLVLSFAAYNNIHSFLWPPIHQHLLDDSASKALLSPGERWIKGTWSTRENVGFWFFTVHIFFTVFALS